MCVIGECEVLCIRREKCVFSECEVCIWIVLCFSKCFLKTKVVLLCF